MEPYLANIQHKEPGIALNALHMALVKMRMGTGNRDGGWKDGEDENLMDRAEQGEGQGQQ